MPARLAETGKKAGDLIHSLELYHGELQVVYPC